MNLNPQIPFALRLTAWLFILTGGMNLINSVVQMLHHEFSLDLGFLWIFVGLGILRLSNGWRWVALIGMVIQTTTLAFIMYRLRSLGIPTGQGRLFWLFPIAFSKIQSLALLFATSLTLIFQFYVLLTPSFVKHFDSKPSSA